MRPRKPQTSMNRTEAEYANYLEYLRRAGQIVAYCYEGLNFRLAPKTHYRPDFLVVCEDHFECHEVKGFWRDDARVKIKVAAELYPWFIFIAVQKVKKQWKYETITKGDTT